MNLHELIFPALKNRSWGYVNIDEEARSSQLNEFSLISYIHKKHCLDFSYGGYMEDRNFIMRNNYQEPRHAWHLGIDYWVPAGTEVYLPVEAILVHSRFDKDQNGGWGGQLWFELPQSKAYLIFGHLDKIIENSGRRILVKAGDSIGIIGKTMKNGGWYPHLHVQAVASKKLIYTYEHTLTEAMDLIDGYSNLYVGIDADYPRPDEIIEKELSNANS